MGGKCILTGGLLCRDGIHFTPGYEKAISRCPENVKENLMKKELGHIHINETFETYDVGFNGHSKEVEIIKKFLLDSARTCIIWGTQGLGKSFLSAASVNHMVLSMHKDAKFISAKKLERLFKDISYASVYYTEKNDARNRLSELRNADLTVIDDVGSEDDSEIFAENFKEFLDDRRHKLIVTTNLNNKDFSDRYGVKIVSRLVHDALTINLRGNDYREKRK